MSAKDFLTRVVLLYFEAQSLVINLMSMCNLWINQYNISINYFLDLEMIEQINVFPLGQQKAM